MDEINKTLPDSSDLLFSKKFVGAIAMAVFLVTYGVATSFHLFQRGIFPSATVAFLLGSLAGMCAGYLLGFHRCLDWATRKYAATGNRAVENDSEPMARVPIDSAGFDPDDEQYPAELDIALQAWRAACTHVSDKSPKDRVIDWLNANYPELKGEQLKRIATICNWDKTGGRPKSGKD